MIFEHVNRWGGAFLCAASAGLLAAAGCGGPRAPSRQEIFRPLLMQPVKAQLAAPGGPLTLEAAIARAMDCDPAVIDARAAADAARVAARAAGTIRDPELRGGVGRSTVSGSESSGGRQVERLILPKDYYTTLYPLPLFEDDNEDGIPDKPIVQHLEEEGLTISTNSSTSTYSQKDRFNSIALRIFPPNPWTYAAEVSGAKAELHEAEAAWISVRLETEIEIRKLFAEGAHAQRDIALLERMLDSRRRLLAAVREGLAAGRYTKPDELQFHRQYLDTLSTLDQARRTFVRVRNQIAAKTGYAKPPEIVFDDGAAGELSADWTPELLWTHALENRGDLAAMHWKALALRAAWREAAADRIPWFSFIQGGLSWSEEDTYDASSGYGSSATKHSIQDGDILRPGYRYDYTERHLGNESDRSKGQRDTEEWRVDAGIVLPIFSWLGKSVEARRAEFHQAQRAAETARDQVRDDVAAALEEARQVDRIRREFAAASEPVLREMKETMAEIESAATFTMDERIRAEQQIIDSERLIEGYTYESAMALIALREKAGGLPLAAPARPAAPAAAAAPKAEPAPAAPKTESAAPKAPPAPEAPKAVPEAPAAAAGAKP